MLEDRDILAVNSPREHVEGPYTVVYKTNEWAIVTLCYDKRPCLGIRWFDAYGGNGNPTSRGYATWFVIPEELCPDILHSLRIDDAQSFQIDKFLHGEIDGNELKEC